MENAPNERVMIVRASGEATALNAGDVMAVVMERRGRPVPSQYKARLGKGVKELLDDGFAPQILVEACLVAIRMARPHLLASYALEIQEAAAGELLTWEDYRAGVRRMHEAHRPKTAIDRALERKERP